MHGETKPTSLSPHSSASLALVAGAALVLLAGSGLACGTSGDEGEPSSSSPPSGRIVAPRLPEVNAPRFVGANVLLISIDTLRADHLAPYGAGFPTPTASRLADEGVVFERAVSQVPLTLPSHCSLLTGLFPPDHGVRDNGGFVLPPEQSTLAEHLNEAGYETAAFVGAYVLDSAWGLEQGFDHYDDSFDYSGLESRSLNEVERPAERVVDLAVDWLARDRDDPFFVWVHLYDPHDPYAPPPRYQTRAPTPYAGEVMYADEQAGRLLDVLEARDLRERTLVIYLSDHGESLGDHGEQTHSIFLYGSTIDVPLIIAPPAGRGTVPAAADTEIDDVRTGDTQGGDAEGSPLLPAGARIAGLARLIDVMPTVLDLVGVQIPNDIHGISLLPTVVHEADNANGAPISAATDAAGARATPNAEQGAGADGPEGRPSVSPGDPQPGTEGPVLDGPVSYAESFYPRFHYGWSELIAVETARWRFIRAPRPELYDRQEDPGEERNLVDAFPAVAATLAAELEAMNLIDPTGAAPSRIEMDPEAEARLRALGYLGGTGGNREGTPSGDSSGSLPDPKDKMPLLAELLRAQRLEADGDPAAAAEILEELAVEDPDNPDVHFALASVRFHLHDYSGSIAAGRRVLELSPDYAIAVHNLALAYQAAGRLDEARLGFERVLELEPDNIKALLSLGELHHDRGELERAAAYYERAAAVAPGIAAVHVNRGNIALEMNRLELARTALTQALELGEESPYLHFNLALIAEQRGDLDAALEEYRAEVTANPRTFKAWINLGLLERQRGRMTAALEAFETAARTSPDAMEGPYLAAETLAAMGRVQEAITWAEQAVTRSPEDPRPRALLERLRQGRR